MKPTLMRRLAPAALATGLALAILIALGSWQLHRLAWKRGLLAQIAAAETAPPIELGDAVPPRFTRVIAHGTLRPATALYGVAVHEETLPARIGADQLQILDRPGHPPLLVDLGWVPVTRDTKPTPAAGPAAITGYVRSPETAGWLSPADDLEGLHFYTLNPTPIEAALHAPDAAALTLIALEVTPRTAPIPAASLPELPNNHLNYALTWFGLGASLVGVFAAWAWRQAWAEG